MSIISIVFMLFAQKYVNDLLQLTICYKFIEKISAFLRCCAFVNL